jgi:hypothetical protein
MHSPSRFPQLLLAAVAVALLAAPLAASERATSRYERMLAQYASLPADQRADWLSWLFTSRLEPACRLTMSRDAYDRVAADQLSVLDRVRSGQEFTIDELADTLKRIDREERAAIKQLTKTFSQATHEAVGTNLWLYQQRMEYLQGVEKLSTHSPYAFENQKKLIDWMNAAILQQRFTGRSPLPPAPDFDHFDQQAWLRVPRPLEVRTAARQDEQRPLSAAELEQRITQYNAALNTVVSSLYASRRYSVDELNAIVDRIAQLGLTRVGLAASALRFPLEEVRQLTPIDTLDDAISLARVKVSATRRGILRVADHDTDRAQWDTLKGLNGVSRRLDMLSTGPDH